MMNNYANRNIELFISHNYSSYFVAKTGYRNKQRAVNC